METHTRMAAVEVAARMENLGLTQNQIAALSGWTQGRVSEVLAGKRNTAPHLAAKLRELAELADNLAQTLYEEGIAQAETGGPVVVASYRADEDFWRDWPDHAGLPASVHRAAALEAVKSLLDDGVEAVIGETRPTLEWRSPTADEVRAWTSNRDTLAAVAEHPSGALAMVWVGWQDGPVVEMTVTDAQRMRLVASTAHPRDWSRVDEVVPQAAWPHQIHAGNVAHQAPQALAALIDAALAELSRSPGIESPGWPPTK